MIRIASIKRVAKRLQENKETFCHVSLKGTNLNSPIGGLIIKLELDEVIPAGAVTVEEETITAKLFSNLKHYSGKSKCCEGDEFNILLGIRLAVSRCINSMMGGRKSTAKKYIKNTQKELDRIVDYQKNLKEYTNHLISKTDNHVNKDS